jgi:hypothetical protein
LASSKEMVFIVKENGAYRYLLPSIEVNNSVSRLFYFPSSTEKMDDIFDNYREDQEKIKEYLGKLIVFSPDGNHYSVIAKSQLHNNAYDIITEKGILDWYQNPKIVGYTFDNKLIYWTQKSVTTGGKAQNSFTLYADKNKVNGPIVVSENVEFDDIYNCAYVQEDGSWGWEKGLINREGKYQPEKFVLRNINGEKEIALNGANYIEYITVNGDLLHSNMTDGGRRLFVDGKDSGINGYAGILINKYDGGVVVSPDGSRIALNADGGIILDGDRIVDSMPISNYETSFSNDNKHLIIDCDYEGYIDGVRIESKAGIGPVNRETLEYVSLTEIGVHDSNENEGYGSMLPRISNFNNIVAFGCKNADGEERLIVNGKDLCSLDYKLENGNITSFTYISFSPDGSQILFKGYRHKMIFFDNEMNIGTFFGKNIRYRPSGSIQYHAGNIIISSFR